MRVAAIYDVHGNLPALEAVLADVDRAVAEVEPGVIVCGHTHRQFDRAIGRHRVINAGSVGLPFEGRIGAFWALLGPEVQLRRSDYDLDAAG